MKNFSMSSKLRFFKMCDTKSLIYQTNKLFMVQAIRVLSTTRSVRYTNNFYIVTIFANQNLDFITSDITIWATCNFNCKGVLFRIYSQNLSKSNVQISIDTFTCNTIFLMVDSSSRFRGHECIRCIVSSFVGTFNYPINVVHSNLLIRSKVNYFFLSEVVNHIPLRFFSINNQVKNCIGESFYTLSHDKLLCLFRKTMAVNQIYCF
mmetsp:Transcript_497/g.557  ORF Transcript_497/g.557 Transcript_497/m.557 type:complete len:206 (+) Transcript_497:2498-3115(+)